MIWIPIASIVIFVLLFIPTVILGVKRGWRSALFVSLIFIGLNAGLIGVGSVLYKEHLWDIYKTYFMGSENKIGSINYDLLAPHYEPRVLLVFGGILSPITYGITLGLYYALRKPLDSYLMPKVKAINSHEKELTYRRNPFASKVSGGVIATATGLFAASFFASAVNVIVTPRENENIFNKFNDAIGRIYSFGMAGNTQESKAISQFLRGVNGDFVTNVQNLVEYDTNTQTFSKADNALVAAEVEKYRFLYESKEATKAVFDALVANISLYNVDVLALGFDQANDADSNIIGKAQATRKIETLITFVNSHNILTANLPETARQALMDRLRGAIMEFKNSAYAQQYSSKVSESSQASQIITGRQKELDNNKSQLTSQESEQRRLVNEIETKAGYTHSTPNASNVMEFPGKTDVTRTTAVSGSSIQREAATEKLYKDSMDQAKAAYDNATTKFNDHTNNQMKHENDVKATKDIEVATQQGVVNTKQSEYDRASSFYSDRQAETTNARNAITSINNEITNLQNRINALPGLISTAKNELDSATTRKTNAETNQVKANTNLQVAQASKSSADSDLQAKQAEYDRLKGLYDAAVKARDAVDSKDPSYASLDAAVKSAYTQMNNASSALSTAKTNASTASTNLSKAQSALNNANSELTNATSNYNSKKSTYDQYTSELSQKQTDIASARQRLSTANTNLSNAITAENNALVAKNSANTSLVTEQSKLKSLQDALNTYLLTTYNPVKNENDRLNSVMQSAQSDWSNKSNTYNNQKNKVDQLIADVNSALGSLPSVNATIVSLNKSIARLEAKTSHTFDPSVDHATWDMANYDDTSIYAAEQYKAFCELKVQQALAIKNAMSAEYDTIKTELLGAFRKYTAAF